MDAWAPSNSRTRRLSLQSAAEDDNYDDITQAIFPVLVRSDVDVVAHPPESVPVPHLFIGTDKSIRVGQAA